MSDEMTKEMKKSGKTKRSLSFLTVYGHYEEKIFNMSRQRTARGWSLFLIIVFAISLVVMYVLLIKGFWVYGAVAAAICILCFFLLCRLYSWREKGQKPKKRIKKLKKYLRKHHSDDIVSLKYYRDSCEMDRSNFKGMESIALNDMLTCFVTPLFTALLTIALTIKDKATGATYYDELKPALYVVMTLLAVVVLWRVFAQYNDEIDGTKTCRQNFYDDISYILMERMKEED